MKPEGYHHVQEVQLTVRRARPRLSSFVVQPADNARIAEHQHSDTVRSSRRPSLPGPARAAHRERNPAAPQRCVLPGLAHRHSPAHSTLRRSDTTYSPDPSTSAYSPFATTSARIVFHPIILGGIVVGKGTTRAQGPKPKVKSTAPVIGKSNKKVGRPAGSKNRPKAVDPDEPAKTPPPPRKERKKRGPNKKKVEERIVPGTTRSPSELLTVNSEAGPSSAPGPSPLGRTASESWMDDDGGSGAGGEDSNDGYQEDEMDIG